MDCFDPSIIALTEINSKTVKDIPYNEFDLKGYDSFYSKNFKRGAALYIKPHFNATPCSILNDDIFEESVWCQFSNYKKEKVLIGCIYKSPNSSQENVNSLLELLKNPFLQCFKHICIVGDFNYPKIKWDDRWTSLEDNKFVETLRDAFLLQMVNKPTRKRTGQAENILDLILVNDSNLVSELVHHGPLGNSDHDTLSFNLNINAVSITDNNPKKFNFRKGNFNCMRKDFSEIDWSVLYSMDTKESWGTIKEHISLAIEKHVPIYRGNNLKVKNKWCSSKLVKLIKKKHKLYKKFCLSRHQIDYEEFVHVRNQVTRDIRLAKKEFEKKLSNNCKKKP